MTKSPADPGVPSLVLPATEPLEPEIPPAGLAAAFGITWLSYASYYLGRKGLSVVKAPLMQELGKDVLVGVETGFLVAYAVGQYLCGMIGDRLGARRLIGIGMLVSAAACLAFGNGTASIAFVVAFSVNGLAQASGWPGNIKAMAEWTTPHMRGSIMGFWATCYQVGGIVASAVAAYLLKSSGWRSAIIYPALWVALIGIVVLVFLKPGPGLKAARATSDPAKESDRDSAPTASTDLRRDAQRAVLRSPTLWSYGASYFCIKLIRYSLLFWLPYYLTTVLQYEPSKAGYMSTSFEVGGVVGTILLGTLSDRFRGLTRSMWSAGSLLGLAGALMLYAQIGASSDVANFVVMALVGALLFGPDTLLSGAAAQDVGGPHGAAIAAGTVNGLGSLGAILQESVTRGVSKTYGWNALFFVFVGLAVLGALALVPTFRRSHPMAGAST